MREKFREFRLSKANKERLALINEIIEEYKAEGYTLTLRQLYYQLVSRDVVANKQEEYTKLSKLLFQSYLFWNWLWKASLARASFRNGYTKGFLQAEYVSDLEGFGFFYKADSLEFDAYLAKQFDPAKFVKVQVNKNSR